MKIFKTISGEVIRVSSNKQKRHFTIKTSGGKYSTYRMSELEFADNLNNTGSDWAQFLKGTDYYPLKHRRPC